jgi:hypothetical protein
MKCALEVRFKICGIKVLRPYEGNLLSVSKCEVDYQGRLFPHCIELQYRVGVEPNTGLLEQDYINGTLSREGDLLLQSLSLLSSSPSWLISYDAILDGVPIELKPSEQDESLTPYEFAAQLDRRTINQRYSVLVRNDGWSRCVMLKGVAFWSTIWKAW